MSYVWREPDPAEDDPGLPRTDPWSQSEVDRLVSALKAMARTHRQFHQDNHIFACFDGSLYWQVLHALDRSGHEDRD